MARKMKDSGIEWIGEIPEGWEITRLKYLADFEPTCDTSYLTDESKITYTPMECVKNGGFENRSALYGNLSHTLTPFQNGDIAMAKVTPCFENGNIAIMNNLFSGFGLGSSELFIFRPKSISTRYFFYWLQNKAFVARACSTMTGTGGLKRISPSFIRNCPVHYPSTDEQTKISDYLDAKCSETDVLLSKTRSSIEEYKKLKQAVITQAVTKGVRGEREMKDSGNPWFGQIPTDWKLSRVGLHFSIILGKMLCNAPLNDTYTLEPYYCAANVHFDGVADGERKKMWFSPIEKDLYRVSVGDLLVVEGGAGAGGSAIVENQDSYTYIQNSIMIVRSKGNTDNRYLRYLLEFLVKQGYIDIVCNKATIPHFTKDKLSCVPFCLCPTGEQKEIADYLDVKCAEIDKLIAKKEQLVKELESYKKSLIYEVVTGKREV